MHLKRIFWERLSTTVLLQKQSQKVFYKISVQKNLAKFTGDRPYRSLSFIKAAACKATK